MTDLTFNCPSCNQHLKAPSDMAGSVISCPSCAKNMKVPVRFPIIIRSSTNSLYAKYIWRAIGWIIGFILVNTATWFLNTLHEPHVGKAIGFLWVIFVLLFFFSLVRLWLDYRRIKNTEYRIFPNKIEMTSYLFRFLGVHNNVVNLAQLRQIQATSNSYLDLWFFKCGSVTLTVSGDVADFEVTNVYLPDQVRRQIEEIAFGETDVEPSTALSPGVDD